MIRKVTLRRFKRFPSLDIDFAGHVVLAGPNNTGKTTVLQAIAAWDFALRRWSELNSKLKPHGTYPFATIARPDFLAVPLPTGGLDLLWNERATGSSVEIGVDTTDGQRIGIEFQFDDEQMRVRPTSTTKVEALAAPALATVYVPPMSGLAPHEPEYADDQFLEGRLAEGRPGEVLRNLLYRTSRKQPAWDRLVQTIERLFGYTLEPPKKGKYLTAEYRAKTGGPTFDLGSAGSGFQQVLMLLTLLAVRPDTVLLVDEPDAHLHVILQDAIFHELHAVAAKHRSQLVLATHSEVIINSVEPEALLLMPQARPLTSRSEQKVAIRGLGILSNTDLMLAAQTPGVLYLEGPTDLDILRAFATVLRHPALDVLTTRLFWHRYSDQARDGSEGFSSREHFEALRLFHADLKGLEIQDRDGNPNLPETAITGSGLQLLRWRRYEIESYLFHPAALERFVVQQVGAGAAPAVYVDPLRGKMAELLTQAYVDRPAEPNRPAEAVLQQDKARTTLLPPILDARGLHAFPYTRYHEIAAVMQPGEVHPEVRAKLDAICRAFGLPLAPGDTP